nr:synaptobrevin, longin-like domain protein [Tanacetum cinerariifolium]
MVAILEKSEHNVDFHPIVDFVEASRLRIETTEKGTKILATIDGNLRTISESSIRRNLKLNDEAGISSLPDVKLFENLTLMGYNISPNQKFTFQKGQFSHQCKYLIHIIMQCLSPKSTGFNEFSSNIATALVCLATNRVYNFSKMIFDGLVKAQAHQLSPITHPPRRQKKSPTTYSSPTLPPVTTANIPPVTPTAPLPTVVPTDTPQLWHYTRTARIAQSLALPPVADEPASPLGDGSQGEACPTDSGLAADQDRANIAKTSTLPSDSAPKSEMVARFEAQGLEINSLKARIKVLEDKDRGVVEQSRDDAPIKGRRWDVGEEAAERVSDDTEEMATVLTSIDAATVLASGVAEIPTGSGSIPTADPSATGVPTGSDVVPTAKLPIERRIELISDLVRNQDNYAKAGWKAKHFKGMTLEEIKEKFKRKGLRLEQKSVKKLKTSEEVKAIEEVSEEKVKEMMRLHLNMEDLNQLWSLVKESLNIRPTSSDKEMELWVELKRLYKPDVKDQLWNHTQNMMHAPVEWKLYDSCGVHHVTSKDNKIFMLIEKDYPLRKGLTIVMISYKLQGRIVGNKMHKEFPLPVIEFPLSEEVPTASEESSHCQKKRDATAVKIALLLKSRSNCQSKSYDSYAKLVPHVTPCILGITEEAERFKRKGLRLEQESVKKLKTSEEVKVTEEVSEEKLKEMMQLEEAERFKRKGLRLEQESVKKLKTSEEVKVTEEVSEEKLKEMMQLVPVEEIYVEALQSQTPYY